MPKPTPEEVLRSIEEPGLDEEMDRVLAMTPEQRKKELEEAGFDLAALHAEADAVYAKMQRASVETRAKELEREGRAKSVRPEARRRPLVLWLAAGVIYTALGPSSPAPTVPPVPPTATTPPASPVDLVAAERLRAEAFAACDAMRWAECLAHFDDAKRSDPAGDTSPEVQIARQKALRAIRDGEKPHFK
jgi:hypothetical protein